jgi:hypothetical protein
VRDQDDPTADLISLIILARIANPNTTPSGIAKMTHRLLMMLTACVQIESKFKEMLPINIITSSRVKDMD